MRKKLIEVALPLDAINVASAREKSIRHGHPSTLHLWWARRPLAAARAVIFAQMVDDPSAQPDRFPTEEAREKERRQRLFRLIEALVKWENTTNETLLQAARDEIRASWRRTCAENADHPRTGELFDPDRLPAFHDPFAGGGALPLEAQRLGLEAHASDLNPVAVLINKAMIEIPPKFAGRPPVNPEAERDYLGARASRPLKDNAGETPAFPGDDLPLRDGGVGAAAYAEAIGLYLGFAQSKACNRNTSLCLWEHRMDRIVATFGRQALPMVWDFAETNPLAGAGGDIFGTVKSVCEVIEKQFSRKQHASALQMDAVTQAALKDKIISTDPPYYDNIGYADLSDFFYVWLRRSLRPVYPDLFATVAVPKAEELVATPYRHGGKEAAETFFLDGMSQAMRRLAEQTHTSFPVTIYYAFKQSESARGTNAGGTQAFSGISTGWETFLDAVIRAGFAVTGTWPIRTEQPKGLRAFEQNALASSIVLVCRKRPADASLATRRQFVTALKAELPAALAHLQSGNIAPVDLAQAAIGPGMAVYTRYARVLDASGKPVSVREALALINQTLDETLAEQEGEFDADSRWALAWFEQHGFDAGEYGAAETLSKAKNTSVGGLVQAGVLASKAGEVRLLKPEELPEDWDPATDPRLTAWETVHQLIRALETGGETAAAGLVRQLGGVAETARELAYRLYAVAERRSRAAEALSYNALVQSWPEIARLARAESVEQSEMF